jgi:hypothetical protein
LTPEAAEALATAHQHLSDAKAISGLRISHVGGRRPAIHGFADRSEEKTWMPTFVGMTGT